MVVNNCQQIVNKNVSCLITISLFIHRRILELHVLLTLTYYKLCNCVSSKQEAF